MVRISPVKMTVKTQINIETCDFVSSQKGGVDIKYSVPHLTAKNVGGDGDMSPLSHPHLSPHPPRYPHPSPHTPLPPPPHTHPAPNDAYVTSHQPVIKKEFFAGLDGSFGKNPDPVIPVDHHHLGEAVGIDRVIGEANLVALSRRIDNEI